MKRLLTIAFAALALSHAALAENDRVDDASYRIEEPTMPAAAAVQADAAPVAERSLVQAGEALSALRAEHARAYGELESAALAATDNAERESIERQAMELKAEQQREELQLLLDQAEARGDGVYAARLREALNADLAAKAEPVRVSVVRDPETGAALSGASEETVR